MVGPALPQAIHVIRLLCADSESSSDAGDSGSNSDASDTDSEDSSLAAVDHEANSDDGDSEADSGSNLGDVETCSSVAAPPEWLETYPVFPITNDELRGLTENAMVVNELENIFSFRHKDRRSQISTLDSTESFRFRRGIYRLMLFLKALPADKVEVDEEFRDDQYIAELQLQRKNFLIQFSTEELVELHSISLFMVEIGEWAVIAGSNNPHTGARYMRIEDGAVIHGPKAVLDAYQDKNPDYLDQHSICCGRSDLRYEGDAIVTELEDYISQPLTEIWKERNRVPPPVDSSHSYSILDNIHGSKGTCDKCHNTYGLDLWNETNWDYLWGRIPTQPAPSMESLWYTGELKAYPKCVQEYEFDIDISFSKMMTAIHKTYSHTRPRLIHMGRKKRIWKKDDWLCENCVEEIMMAYLPKSLAALVGKDGKIDGSSWMTSP